MGDWCSQHPICWNEAIAVAMVASIAHTITKRCLNPKGSIYCNKDPKTIPAMAHQQDKMDAVFDLVRMIPAGRVSTYGAIAAAIGLKSGARWVGYCMNLSHQVVPKVPAHRVVNSAGLLTGRHHFTSPEQMQLLLEQEGVTVVDHQVKNFKKLLWEPLLEL